MRPDFDFVAMAKLKTLLVCAAGLLGAACADTPGAPAADADLQSDLVRILSENEDIPGVAVAIIGPGDDYLFAAAGEADPSGRAMTVDTPVRIASITKTYVAATILRLWETGALDLDAPIAGLIDPGFADILRDDGYDPGAITVRHLLMHVSGMPDHADDQYVNLIVSDPTREWTRAEQVALLAQNHDPNGAPGERFQYSDTGYILLGDIIERITGETLAASVRRLLKLDALNLSNTWWERVEERPAGANEQATQSLGGMATRDWSPTIDLYGGGGIVASTHDMAAFWAALMRGRIFDNDETLALMLSAPGHPFPRHYRLGVSPIMIGEHEVYSHSGFWGTLAIIAPDLDIAIAGTVTDQQGYGLLLAYMKDRIADLYAQAE